MGPLFMFNELPDFIWKYHELAPGLQRYLHRVFKRSIPAELLYQREVKKNAHPQIRNFFCFFFSKNMAHIQKTQKKCKQIGIYFSKVVACSRVVERRSIDASTCCSWQKINNKSKDLYLWIKSISQVFRSFRSCGIKPCNVCRI